METLSRAPMKWSAFCIWSASSSISSLALPLYNSTCSSSRKDFSDSLYDDSRYDSHDDQTWIHSFLYNSRKGLTHATSTISIRFTIRHIFERRYHPSHCSTTATHDARSTIHSITSRAPALMPGRQMQRQILETTVFLHPQQLLAIVFIWSSLVPWHMTKSENQHIVILHPPCFICFCLSTATIICMLHFFFLFWLFGTSVVDNTSSKGRVMS